MATLLKLVWVEEAPQARQKALSDEAAPLVVPPEAEMQVLYRIARIGNMQDIRNYAAHLAELDERYRPFSEKLSALAKGYQSKAILKLAQQYVERKEVSQDKG
jgi:hypothetical protein